MYVKHSHLMAQNLEEQDYDFRKNLDEDKDERYMARYVFRKYRYHERLFRDVAQRIQCVSVRIVLGLAKILDLRIWISDLKSQSLLSD